MCKTMRPIGKHRKDIVNLSLRNYYYGYLTRGLNSVETILDVGTGDGRFSLWAGERGFKVTAIDVQPQHEWIQKTDFLDAPFEKNSFDLVYCSHVLEHIPNHFQFAEKLENVARKYLIVICPLPNKSFWDEPTHYRPYTAEALRRLFFRLKPIRQLEINLPLISSSAAVVFQK